MAVAASFRNDSEVLLNQPPKAGENLAHFWDRRGAHVFEMDGVFWARWKGPFFMSLPLHLTLDLDPEKADEILRKSRVAGLRFPVEGGRGIDSGLYVCRPAEFSMKSVSRKQRNHVLRGQDKCEIRLNIFEPGAGKLVSQGLELNRETLLRQGRSDPTFSDPGKWQRFAAAVGDSPGMLSWGAFIDGRLSTYIVGCRDGDWLHLMYKASRTADLARCASHALDFSIASRAAAEGVRMISNGSTSLTPNEGLDRYKRQMGYSILPQKHAIHFHPLLAPALGGRIPAALGRAAHRFFGNGKAVSLWRLMEGARATRELCAVRT